jgi:hypothetical protein
VSMVSHPTHAISLAVRVSCNGGKIGVEFRASVSVKDRLALLGAEDEVDNNEA